MAKPDAQTVAQMAATIASGLAANSNVRTLVPIEFAKTAVGLARAVVAEVERTQPEEPRRKLTKRDDDRPDHHHGQ